jgi:hypothetical protein
MPVHGKGMGAATRGGGAVEKGAKNRMESNPASGKTGPVMMAMGGMMTKGYAAGGAAVSPRKKMAMGMMGGGMMKKGYAAGGAAMKKKMMAAGGKRAK